MYLALRTSWLAFLVVSACSLSTGCAVPSDAPTADPQSETEPAPTAENVDLNPTTAVVESSTTQQRGPVDVDPVDVDPVDVDPVDVDPAVKP